MMCPIHLTALGWGDSLLKQSQGFGVGPTIVLEETRKVVETSAHGAVPPR